MKLATGIDLIEVERIQATIDRHGSHFLERIFTPHELAEMGNKPASLAARFAAKEAAAKALGTGIGEVSWTEIEIRNGPAKEPVLFFYGKAAKLAMKLGLQTWSVSLSHTHSHAVAVVVGLGG